MKEINNESLRLLQDLIISLKLQVDQADKIIKELRLSNLQGGVSCKKLKQ